MTMLSHMLDCQIYGLRPWGHHLTNVLLHAANTVLLFLVLTRMTGGLWRSASVAALFAAHPAMSNRWPGWPNARMCSAPFFGCWRSGFMPVTQKSPTSVG